MISQRFDPSTLFWLSEPDAGFSDELSSLSLSASPARELRRLSSFRLNSSQLRRLKSAVGDLRRTEFGLAQLSQFRSLSVGVLGNRTLDFLTDCLSGSGLRHGLSIDVQLGEYGSLFQNVFDAQGGVVQGTDAVVLIHDAGAFAAASELMNQSAHEKAVLAARNLIERTLHSARESFKCPIVLSTIVYDPDDDLNASDIIVDGSTRRFINDVNMQIIDLAKSGEAVVWDLDHLAASIGRRQWCDPVSRHSTKSPFAIRLAPVVADHLCATLAGLFGKARRGLILDLDNTLWSGVIGDDGIGGIVIGQGDAVGEAHLALQRHALELRRRGIVLAVCSKNDDAIAREPFRAHPEMLLREDHIAVFQANWSDKASNIVSIAKTLDLGLDAFVFVDDNPAERARVRRELPEVAVPELPDDPAWYTACLSAAHYFENPRLNAEDLDRAKSYQDNARRAEMLSQIGNYDDYLRSLEMTLTVSRFDELGKVRITQLISKSNQFNLTTRRYQLDDVDDISRDPASIGLQFRLTDAFGDNGIISVVVLRRNRTFAYIDLWVMSCRVLKRGVEAAVLHEIAKCAREAGVRDIIGEYIPTPRNGLVRDHYEKLGFDRLEPSDAVFDRYTPVGELWRASVDKLCIPPVHMKVVCSHDSAARPAPCS